MLGKALVAAAEPPAAPKPIKFTAPSGRVYTWTKPSPPTQDDIDAIVEHEKSLGPSAMQVNTAVQGSGGIQQPKAIGPVLHPGQTVQQPPPPKRATPDDINRAVQGTGSAFRHAGADEARLNLQAFRKQAEMNGTEGDNEGAVPKYTHGQRAAIDVQHHEWATDKLVQEWKDLRERTDKGARREVPTLPNGAPDVPAMLKDMEAANVHKAYMAQLSQNISSGIGKAISALTPASYIPGLQKPIEHANTTIASGLNPLAQLDSVDQISKNPVGTVGDTVLQINKIWGRVPQGDAPVTMEDRIDGLITLVGTAAAAAEPLGKAFHAGKITLPEARMGADYLLQKGVHPAVIDKALGHNIVESAIRDNPALQYIEFKANAESGVDTSLRRPPPPPDQAPIQAPAALPTEGSFVDGGAKQPWEMTKAELSQAMERAKMSYGYGYNSVDYSLKTRPIEQLTHSEFPTSDNEPGINFYKDKLKAGQAVDPIIVDVKGRVIDGNHRLAAYRELGIRDVPVLEAGGSGTGAIDASTAVETALAEGKPVPANVLADYPDLAAKAQPQVAPGKPVGVRLFHGTYDNIKAFDGGRWTYLSESEKYASHFADPEHGGQIHALDANIANPLDITDLSSRASLSKLKARLKDAGIEIPNDAFDKNGGEVFWQLRRAEVQKALTAQAKALGYDGLKFNDEIIDPGGKKTKATTWVAFDPDKQLATPKAAKAPPTAEGLSVDAVAKKPTLTTPATKPGVNPLERKTLGIDVSKPAEGNVKPDGATNAAGEGRASDSGNGPGPRGSGHGGDAGGSSSAEAGSGKPEQVKASSSYTSPTNRPLTRNYRAGDNNGSVTFSSPLHRDLYDVGSQMARTSRGAGERGVSLSPVDQGKMNALIDHIAEQTGKTSAEVRQIAADVFKDSKAQMKGIADGENRAITGKAIPEDMRMAKAAPSEPAKIEPAKAEAKPEAKPSEVKSEPKAEAKPAETPKPESTGLANQVQERETLAKVIDDVEPTKGGSKQHWQEQGKKAYDELHQTHAGRIAAVEDIASRIAAGEEELTGIKVGQLLEGKRNMLADIDTLEQRLAADPKNAALAKELAAKREGIQNFLNNVQAGKGRWSDVGRALQAGSTINEGVYSEVIAHMERTGNKVDPKTKAQLEEMTATVAKQDAYIKQLEAAKQGEAIPAKPRKFDRASVQKEIEGLLEEFKNNKPSSPGVSKGKTTGAISKFTVEDLKVGGRTVRIAYDLVKAHVKLYAGAPLEDLVLAVQKTFREKLGIDIDRQAVIDLAAQPERTATRTEIARQRQQLIQEARRNSPAYLEALKARKEAAAAAERARILSEREVNARWSEANKKAAWEDFKAKEKVAKQAGGKVERLRKSIEDAKTKAEDLKKQLEEGRFRTPTKREIVVDKELADARAMRDIYAKKVQAAIRAHDVKTGKVVTGIKTILGVTRSLKLGSDIGVVARQGLIGAGHPMEFLRSIGEAAKTITSEKNFATWERASLEKRVGGQLIEPIRQKAGLSRTSIGINPEELGINTVLSKIPVVGGGLERFQHTFINNFRNEVFDSSFMKGLTENELKQRASFINNLTGRGNIKSVPKALEVIMTSPRYESSRWGSLGEFIKNPATLVKDGKWNRGAAENIATLVKSGVSLYALIKAAEAKGYKMNWDPESPDFGKMRQHTGGTVEWTPSGPSYVGGKPTDDVWDLSAGLAPRARDLLRIISAIADPGYKKNITDILGKTAGRTISPGVSAAAEQASLGLQRKRGVSESDLKSPLAGFAPDEEQKGLWALAPLIVVSIKQAGQANPNSSEFDYGGAAWAGFREFIGTGVNRYPAKK